MKKNQSKKKRDSLIKSSCLAEKYQKLYLFLTGEPIMRLHTHLESEGRKEGLGAFVS